MDDEDNPSLDYKTCRDCGLSKPVGDFPVGKRRTGTLYIRPNCYACKYKKEGRVPDKAYHRSYYYANKLDFRYKAYRYRDLKFGHKPLERDEAVALMHSPCAYCGCSPSHGLDRIDNAEGHSAGNVRPCCEKCNFILGDLPDAAKLGIGPALRELHKQGALESWTIPTKRYRK